MANSTNLPQAAPPGGWENTETIDDVINFWAIGDMLFTPGPNRDFVTLIITNHLAAGDYDFHLAQASGSGSGGGGDS